MTTARPIVSNPPAPGCAAGYHKPDCRTVGCGGCAPAVAPRFVPPPSIDFDTPVRSVVGTLRFHASGSGFEYFTATLRAGRAGKQVLFASNGTTYSPPRFDADGSLWLAGANFEFRDAAELAKVRAFVEQHSKVAA